MAASNFGGILPSRDPLLVAPFCGMSSVDLLGLGGGKNTVKILSITTSGPELWRFEKLAYGGSTWKGPWYFAQTSGRIFLRRKREDVCAYNG